MDILVSKRGLARDLKERLDNVAINIETVVNRLPGIEELVDREMSCNYRKLYEVIVNGLKNVMVSIQQRRARGENETREYLISRVQYMVDKFGEDSMQAEEQRELLL